MLTDDGNSVSKRSKNQELYGTGVDRISDLPESVLLYILSFLSALYVVRTSVLSRRWQYVWTGVPCLSFGYEVITKLGGREKYVNFVNRFLFQYKATSIEKFRSESTQNNSPDTESWIRWAINRNVRELDISFGYTSSSHHLPQTIFGCRTLVVLKLKGHPISMAFPPSACIPCLKTLELDSVSSLDGQFENNLISCSVVLENLSIRKEYGWLKGYRVHAKQLKRFRIKFHQTHHRQTEDNVVIDINAPSLEHLDIEVTGTHSLLLANVGNLRKAKISLNDPKAFQSLLKCISALKNVKFLYLPSMPPHTKQACNLKPGPMVHNVNLTHFGFEARSVWFQLLPYFFHCFPNLEVLRLKKNLHVNNYQYAVKLCTEPKHLPRGLLSHLRVFVVEEFSGTNDELDMLEFILMNGEVLDLVEIMYLCSSQIAELTTRKGTKAYEFERKLIVCEEVSRKHELKFQVAQKILDFPRASRKCRIKFSDAV